MKEAVLSEDVPELIAEEVARSDRLMRWIVDVVRDEAYHHVQAKMAELQSQHNKESLLTGEE